jgi:hypothetical protein
MSVLVYATESWILAIIGLAWMAVRNMFDSRSYIEEYLIAGQLLASTINTILVGVSETNNHNCRAYFTITLCQWLIGAYAAVDSYADFSIHKVETFQNYTSPTGLTCCPNANAGLQNRQIYFSGFSFYLLPMSVTMAFQTVQVMVAAGALTHTQHNLWPGFGFGYAILWYTSAVLNIKLLGIISRPCPSTTIYLLGDWIQIDVFWFIVLFMNAFVVTAAAEDLINNRFTKLLWHSMGGAFMGLFAYTVWQNFKDMNLITWPLASLVFIAGVPVLYLYITVFRDYRNPVPVIPSAKPAQKEIANDTKKLNTNFFVKESSDMVSVYPEELAGNTKSRVRTKFVFPMQAELTPKVSKHD